MKTSKQDRTFVRTASELERKLGVKKSFREAQGQINSTQQQVGRVEQSLSDELESKIGKLSADMKGYLRASAYQTDKADTDKNLAEINAKLKELCNIISGAETEFLLETGADFAVSQSNEPVWCRKNGVGTVEFGGEISPANDENEIATATGAVICTLPDGYRPKSEIRQLFQDNSLNLWVLTVSPNGVATAGCYRNANGNLAPTTSACMRFYLTFMANGGEQDE